MRLTHGGEEERWSRFSGEREVLGGDVAWEVSACSRAGVREGVVGTWRVPRGCARESMRGCRVSYLLGECGRLSVDTCSVLS